jgi:hypothetical protein
LWPALATALAPVILAQWHLIRIVVQAVTRLSYLVSHDKTSFSARMWLIFIWNLTVEHHPVNNAEHGMLKAEMHVQWTWTINLEVRSWTILFHIFQIQMPKCNWTVAVLEI